MNALEAKLKIKQGHGYVIIDRWPKETTAVQRDQNKQDNESNQREVGMCGGKEVRRKLYVDGHHRERQLSIAMHNLSASRPPTNRQPQEDVKRIYSKIDKQPRRQ